MEHETSFKLRSTHHTINCSTNDSMVDISHFRVQFEILSKLNLLAAISIRCFLPRCQQIRYLSACPVYKERRKLVQSKLLMLPLWRRRYINLSIVFRMNRRMKSFHSASSSLLWLLIGQLVNGERLLKVSSLSRTSHIVLKFIPS